MSWWVYLEDRTAEPWCSYGVSPDDFVPAFEGEEPCPSPCYPAVTVKSHREGGTYVMGGSSEAALNITYNYGDQFRRALVDGENSGLKEVLHERKAADVLPALERAVQTLGTTRSDDYWASTPGNAGCALDLLRRWARQHPDAVFRVS